MGNLFNTAAELEEEAKGLRPLLGNTTRFFGRPAGSPATFCTNKAICSVISEPDFSVSENFSVSNIKE
jgi:hypothetical protein